MYSVYNMKRTILLIEPPYLDLYGKSEVMTKPYFPLGLGYIASSLLKTGHRVKLLISSDDFLFHQKVVEAIEEVKPDIIGFSAMTTNFPRAVYMARQIKEKYQLPIMIGGHHVSAFKEKILNEYADLDYVVYGEGEDTVTELVNSFGERDLDKINGLIWRHKKGVVSNPPRKLLTDLDSIPFPARDLVDISKFSTHSHIAGGKSATILTSRGCPFGCVFCSAHVVDGKKYRQHSVDYVLSEIDILVNKYNVQYIFLQDDTFTFSKKRALNICKAIASRKYNIRFGCFSRTDVMDYEFAIALKKAGFENIWIGIR